MEPATINLIVSLISGIIGGHLAGAAMQEKTLGGFANSLSGLLGGGIGGYILKVLGFAAANQAGAAAAAEQEDQASIIANIGASGAILTAFISLIKNAADKHEYGDISHLGIVFIYLG